MNRCIVSGFLTKDVKINKHQNIATTQIAVARDYPFNKDVNGKEVVDFLSLKFIGEKNVIQAMEWLNKGSSIIIDGRHQQDIFYNEDGTRSRYDYILVVKWEFQKVAKKDEGKDKKKAEEEQNGEQTSTPFFQVPNDYEMNMDDIDPDLPFIK